MVFVYNSTRQFHIKFLTSIGNCGSKTIVRPSHLHNRISCFGKTFTKLLQVIRALVQCAMRNASAQSSINVPLQWRHNDHYGVSNHHPRRCLLNRLFRRRSKNQISALLVLCAGNSSVTGEFPAQWAAKNVPIWWRHHVLPRKFSLVICTTEFRPIYLSYEINKKVGTFTFK